MPPVDLLAAEAGDQVDDLGLVEEAGRVVLGHEVAGGELGGVDVVVLEHLLELGHGELGPEDVARVERAHLLR